MSRAYEIQRPVTIDEAKRRLVDLLEDIVGTATVDVVYWDWEHTACGVRIAEITFSTPREQLPPGVMSASGSIMQCHCPSFEALFAAERFVVDSVLGTLAGGVPEMYEERLRELLSSPKGSP